MIRKIPSGPGVYMFRDSAGNIIYIGKSKDLKKRVSSYFTRTEDPKTRELVRKISDAEFIVVASELEALLLENRLIKTHKPHYNISLKDSSTYPYIKVTGEKFPRIISTRVIKDGGSYFGPYVDSLLKNYLLEMANKSFGIRTCRKMPRRECLNYHIGICCAPCIKKVSQRDYMRRIMQAKQFLSGNNNDMKQSLTEKMKEDSVKMRYEAALEKRKQLEVMERMRQRQRIENVKDFDQDVIAYASGGGKHLFEVFFVRKGLITNRKEFFVAPVFEETVDEIFENFTKTYYSGNEIPSEIIVSRKFWADEKSRMSMERYLSRIAGRASRLVFPVSGERHDLVMLAQSNAEVRVGGKLLSEISNNLGLPQIPVTIECFDVSSLSYDHIVGSMVRFVDGQNDKGNYRKFAIRGFSGRNDDFAAMKEIVHRRYSRLLKEDRAMPDLIVVDGGRGQLSAAMDALHSLGLKIPVIGIAKKNEDIFTASSDEPLRFARNSPMMLFLRSVRDEAHRFAIGYNRKRREMRLRTDAESRK